MGERQDPIAEQWKARPWIMASICGVCGLAIWFFTDHDYLSPLSAINQAMATFVAVATVSFVLTIERLRWTWSLGFAGSWALIAAFVGWYSASYDRLGSIFEWPYFSGLFAALVAAPLFQTVRDEGAWRFPYSRLHSHVWTDAIIGAASLLFTGLTFLLGWLIAGLFDVIGIDLLSKLLQEKWSGFTLAGFAFGAAVGIFREQDRLVPTLQRLVVAVLSVLAPVLAIALILFLVSIVFTGLQGLWDSWVSATALLLAASAGAIVLINAVIGASRDDRPQNAVLQSSVLALTAVILPLVSLAAVALGLRIGQYGWTPERMWGGIAIGGAGAYGICGWWAIIRARREFDELLRPIQTRLMIASCLLALFLALPIIDFGLISARSQLSRIEKGAVKPAQFDWAAMAFDFGPAGRSHLARIARSGPSEWRDYATKALLANERSTLASNTATSAEISELAARIRIASDDLKLSPEILRQIIAKGSCLPRTTCALLKLDQNRLLLVTTGENKQNILSTIIDLRPTKNVIRPSPTPRAAESVELGSVAIELRPIKRQQLFVDGRPVGEPVE